MLKTLSFTTLATVLLLAAGPGTAQDTTTEETAGDEPVATETDATAETASDAETKEGAETNADTEEGADTAADAEATDEATETDATAGDTDAQEGEDGEFDLGREVQQDPTYIKEEYGDWQMRCFRTQAEEDPCQMFQLLKDENGNPTAEFTIFRLKEGGPAVAGATVTAPLFTLLTAEVKITVDGGASKSYPFRFCSQAGCVAQIGLTEADVNAFKRGVKATVTIVPAQAPDQNVAIPASLSGFTAAYDNVSVIEN
ncbi:invasion associated locus B family protein [Roseovarius sp. SCSIO 43702]|uniref:invasion associated locus B family protein n=1 Tax=Roseovarius sp. SCSIO 43702 TaxID=2823043 RepID=UPI001C72A5DA|nr:invasion associated locus B family protein [Roseovarius sp. SCSIO 43702]QYX55316.1 invasion associated locus B family protein [Roseovarius sp. SCSIO 43702]